MEKETNEKKIAWKKVTIGGITGIMAGAAATLYTGGTGAQAAQMGAVPESDLELDQPVDVVDSDVVIEEDLATEDYSTQDSSGGMDMPQGVNVASSVSEGSSFSEAFAAARAEVGSGGVFEWNGNLYNTFYADEWDEMTTEQKQEFSSNVSYTQSEGLSSESAEAEVEVEDYSQQDYQSYDQEGDQEGEKARQHETRDGHYAQEQYSSNDSGDSEVQILGVTTEAGPCGNDVNLAYAEIDGDQVLIVDVDNDGVFDIIAGDYNGDGELSENEMEDISSEGITVEDLRSLVVDDNQMDFGSCGSDGCCCGDECSGDQYDDYAQQNYYNDQSMVSNNALGLDSDLPDYAAE